MSKICILLLIKIHKKKIVWRKFLDLHNIFPYFVRHIVIPYENGNR